VNHRPPAASRLPVVAAAGLAIAAALTIGMGPSAASTAAKPAAVRTGAAPAQAVAAQRDALLVNGDRIAITSGPGGRSAVTVIPSARGFAGSLLRLSAGGTSYEIPAVALPYLGRGLDPSLFDVSALAARARGGMLPVRVSYTGAEPSLPGVRITSAGAGVAAGYLTASSAQVFGAALLRQFQADHAQGSYGTDGIFAGGVTVSLAGTRPAQRPAPRFPMHTLTVDGTNLAGKPDTGDVVMVFNADDASRLAEPPFLGSVNDFYRGTAKFSVPAGHYWAIAVFTDMNRAGAPVAQRFAILPQFTVTANTSVAVAERSAGSEAGFRTPRPSVPGDVNFQLMRLGAAGPIVNIWGSEVEGFPMWVSPTSRRPTVGGLRIFTFGQLFSPAGAANPYEYNVTYQDLSGLVHSQQITVDPRSLATAGARYYADVAGTGGVLQGGLFPLQIREGGPGGGYAFSMPVPEQRTEYLTAGSPAVQWYTQYFQGWGALSGGQQDTWRTFRAGQVTAAYWNAYPLHTAPSVNVLGAASAAPALVSASRSGDTLTLDMTPFSDGTPGHTGSGYLPGEAGSVGTFGGTYEIDQNGTKIASGSALTSPGWSGGDFYKQVPVRPGPSTIRFVLNASRTGQPYPLSTASQTVWTWHSVAQPGATVPPGWACVFSPRTRLTGRDCAPQPLLTLEYAVPGLTLTGRAGPGPQTVDISAGHLQLAKAAKVTHVTAQVSLNDGKTWVPATVTGSGGAYRATFGAPAGSLVTLRVTAADAAGGQIAETITRAYAVS